LIPVFVVLYIKAEEPYEYVAAAVIVFISGLTDFLDGFIARTFHMVTEFGKLIDPMADKLTQASLIFVLIVKVRWMFLLLIIFVAFQLFLVAAGLYMFKRGLKLNGSRWFGKVSTTVFYAVMLVLIAVPNLNHNTVNILMIVCGSFLLLSFALYGKVYLDMYRKNNLNDE
jgi:cardiolipin synthase